MFRVLVTGFEPFNNAKLNPSEELVRSLKQDDVAGAQIITAVLPVVYTKAAEHLLALIEEHQPDAVISFGQAEGRKAITPERFAVNLDDASISDNSGSIRIDRIIQPEGETAYSSTLPVKELVASIKATGVTAAISLTAGTFVCNHIFYEMQHALRGKSILSGFVHVPLMTEQENDFPGLFTMEIEQMVLAAKAIIALLVAHAEN
jgi:pyroglutamyl-peptidase